MNRNDTYAYHSNKLLQAEYDIRNHSSRLALLDDPAEPLLQHLWHDERLALINLHKQGMIRAVERACEADKWITAQAAPGLEPALFTKMVERLADLMLGERLPLDIVDSGLVIIPASRVVTKTMLAALVNAWHRDTLQIDPSPIRNRILQTLEETKP